MNSKLRRLYDASEEDMTYGIGVLDLGTGPPAPIIRIRYRGWSRAKLEIIRESFRSGIILSSARRNSGLYHACLGTRETMTIEHAEGEHTDVLRAPAWDAHLADIDGAAFAVFDTDRRRRGGFLLLMQAGEWEFLTVVDELRDQAIVGVTVPLRTQDLASRTQDTKGMDPS